MLGRAERAGRSPGAASSDAALADPLPLLLLRRGPVPLRALGALNEDRRLELFVADELTPEWISFAQRAAGTLVVSEGDPLSALGYAITAGIREPIAVGMPARYRADALDLIAAGATVCVTFPLVRREVDRLVPLLIHHAGGARVDTTLRLLLDPVSRIVRFRNSRLRFSQREFAVLHCLSSRHGRPVSADDLLTYVWGDAEPHERSRQILDVYICQVRRKLERIGLSGAIGTVRGFGYSLVQVTGPARAD